MNENVMSQLDAELEHAGEETALSPQMLLLEQLRITPEKELPKMDFLFRLFGKPCFPRRELVAITGKAKSGKTFVTSMLMACCQVSDVLSFHREPESPLRLLWYDTEQSDESTQDILRNRVMRMADGGGKLFDIFNVRGVPWKERRDLLCEAVKRCKPDLVIVDGIRDLVNDINDGVLAQEVMEELMHLATEHDCCIVCVLHQNKSKLMPQRIFSLEQTLTRKYDIERTMYFEVGDDGLPVTCDVPTDGGSKDKTDGYPQLNTNYICHDEHDQWQVDVRRLFSDAIGGRQQVTGAELRSEVCRLSNIRSWKFYNSLLEQAVNGEVIMKSYDHAAHVIYALRPQAPVQTELYQDDEPF